MKEHHRTDYIGAGIYALFNMQTLKIYIGSSNNIAARFTAHRALFNKKSTANEMYQEPLDDFGFFILQKLSPEIYEKHKNSYEIAYMLECERCGLKLYNKVPADKEISLCLAFLYEIDSYNILQNSFKDRFGSRPTLYASRKPENRVLP